MPSLNHHERKAIEHAQKAEEQAAQADDAPGREGEAAQCQRDDPVDNSRANPR